MIIVWLSIALVIISLIWLVARVLKTSRVIKDKVIRCTKSAEILRKGTEEILKSNEKLKETTSGISKGLEKKREDILYLKDQSGALAETVSDSKEQLVDAYRTLKNKLEV